LFLIIFLKFQLIFLQLLKKNVAVGQNSILSPLFARNLRYMLQQGNIFFVAEMGPPPQDFRSPQL